MKMTNLRNPTLRDVAIVLLLTTVVSAHAPLAWSETPPLVRVRSNDPAIAAIMHEAAARSIVFRRLIQTIDATDGLVYVDEGKCGHGVSACLTLSVQVAGPHRLLRILLDPRRDKNNCDLMASIGHELWHAIELLGEPSVRNYHTAYSFFEREGPTDRTTGRFETPAAIRMGLAVLGEVCVR